jgi:hypothetical protein
MIATVQPTTSSGATFAQAPARRPLELLEARQLRDSLKALLREEQAAMADFLVALADFDRRRGWEPLGHASLFAFLLADLGLTPAPTFWRQEAARLLQRFPDLEEPLRHGTLCLTTMAELAKVLTVENREAVLPRFLGISTREAKEIVAELQPREAPATRSVVTRVQGAALAAWAGAGGTLGTRGGLETGGPGGAAAAIVQDSPSPPAQDGCTTGKPTSPTPTGAPRSQLWAHKVDFGGLTVTVARRDEVEPLSADRSRIHVSVTRTFTRKLEAARQGLGHSIPNATMEQVLEAGLDLLLEKQARVRGQVKRPRTMVAATAARVEGHSVTNIAQRATPTQPPREPAPPLTLIPPERPSPRRLGPRETIPAAVRRAVWERDGGRCSWPLDGGGRCGSTHQLELDHIHPWARDGQPTVDNLRLVCRAHNTLEARREFGARCVERYRVSRGA